MKLGIRKFHFQDYLSLAMSKTKQIKSNFCNLQKYCSNEMRKKRLHVIIAVSFPLLSIIATGWDPRNSSNWTVPGYSQSTPGKLESSIYITSNCQTGSKNSKKQLNYFRTLIPVSRDLSDLKNMETTCAGL